MTDLLPLVPGCRALVTSGLKAGSEVVCIKHLGKMDAATVKAISMHDCWEVDQPMPWIQVNGNHETMMLNIFPTKYLMRIDGDYKNKVQDAQITKILEKST